EGKPYLGLTGSLLKEYAVEAAKKENLLRKSLQDGSAAPVAPAPGTAPAVAPRGRTTSLDSTGGSLQRTNSATQTVEWKDQLPPLPRRPSKTAVPVSAAGVVNDIDSLAMVLELMQSKVNDERLQRACLMAITRLSKDVVSLRPLCLGVISAIAQSAARGRQDLTLQRMAVSALSSVAYAHDVAALVAPLALPVVIEAALAFPEDGKLQSNACEAFARLAQGGSNRVVYTMVKYLSVSGVVFQVLCDALQRLCENHICQGHHVLDELIKLSDGDPSNLELQRRVALSLNRLSSSVISPAAVRQRTSLTAQWAHLLERFLRAEEDEAKLDGDFHHKVQELFHEEVALHFELEAAERCLHYLRSGRPAQKIFSEVIRALAENLEDYRSRSEARELAWDVERQCLAPLEPMLRLRLHNEVLTQIERRLPSALCTAAKACSAWPCEEQLSTRTESLMKDCGRLLETKTEVTQVHFEKAAELRREVMLFEAVEYLELHSAEASATQVLSALQMLKASRRAAASCCPVIASSIAGKALGCRVHPLVLAVNSKASTVF
ncbi:unnamed protein product, partial [Cladocopium goreaui]